MSNAALEAAGPGVEPAAALPLAALQSRRYTPRADENVGLILCGANMDPASLN